MGKRSIQDKAPVLLRGAGNLLLFALFLEIELLCLAAGFKSCCRCSNAVGDLTAIVDRKRAKRQA